MFKTLQEVYDKRRSYRRHFRAVRNKIKQDHVIEIPDGLYEQCPECGVTLFKQDILDNNLKCPKCNHHLRVGALNRFNMIMDQDSFFEKGIGYITQNPLSHDGYLDKIAKAQETTHTDEAYTYVYGHIGGQECVVGVLDSFFLMGSMGSVVGEKVTKSIEFATSKRVPIIIFSASGGARMQEGLFSLMQMAKTSQALKKHEDAGLLFVSILTDPTYGGVTASFAMLGDIIIAEPKAMIGFAGPRVIKNTIQSELPEGFQTAEFLLEKGFVDLIVDRDDLKATLTKVLLLHNR